MARIYKKLHDSTQVPYYTTHQAKKDTTNSLLNKVHHLLSKEENFEPTQENIAAFVKKAASTADISLNSTEMTLMVFTLDSAYHLFKQQKDGMARSYADMFHTACTQKLTLTKDYALSRLVASTTRLWVKIYIAEDKTYNEKEIRSNVVRLIKHSIDNDENDAMKNSFIKFSDEEKTQEFLTKYRSEIQSKSSDTQESPIAPETENETRP